MNQRLTASQAEKTKKITMIGLMTAVTCILGPLLPCSRYNRTSCLFVVQRRSWEASRTDRGIFVRFHLPCTHPWIFYAEIS